MEMGIIKHEYAPKRLTLRGEKVIYCDRAGGEIKRAGLIPRKGRKGIGGR